MRKFVHTLVLTVLLASIVALSFHIEPVGASGTIYIRPDGSIEGTDKIVSADKITYTFIDNINDSIVVERSNIIIDGVGYTLKGNGSGIGIDVTGRSNVTIKNLEIRSFSYGINLLGSSSNTVSMNNIRNNYYGIFISYSPNNILRNNHMIGNRYSFCLNGRTFNDTVNDVDASNTVNGRPICYWINRRDAVVPLDASCVILVNCTNIKVENQTLTDNFQGILLAFTHNSTISGNIIANNRAGCMLYHASDINIAENEMRNDTMFGIGFGYSSNITVIDNAITSCRGGVHVAYSISNIVSDNNVTNGYMGIFLFKSSNNTICKNNIVDNWNYGMYLYGRHRDHPSSSNIIYGNIIRDSRTDLFFWYSSNNSLYHNNFVDYNLSIALWDSFHNTFNNGYPSGGNYWSVYNGTDLYSGPYQNESGSDGIGDTPYVIDADTRDNYPLMKAWEWPILGDINYDFKVDMKDLSSAAMALGSYPSHPRWDLKADLTGSEHTMPDNRVDMIDLVLIASHFGETDP